MTGYTLIDYAIMVIFFYSIFAGLMRGFLREFFSILSWVIAAFVASVFSAPFAQYFSGPSQAAIQSLLNATGSSMTASSQTIAALTVGFSFVCIFIVTLMACSILVYIISSAMLVTGMSIFNRILGAAFGFVRGYFITVIVVFVLMMTPVTAQPAWTNSQLEPIFDPAAAWLSNVVSPSLQVLKDKALQAVQGMSSQLQNVGSTLTNFAK